MKVTNIPVEIINGGETICESGNCFNTNLINWNLLFLIILIFIITSIIYKVVSNAKNKSYKFG